MRRFLLLVGLFCTFAAVRQIKRGIPSLGSTGYTGRTSNKNVDFREIQDIGSTIRLETIDALWPDQGLTVSIFWPAGAVDRLVFQGRTTSILSDNRGPFIGLTLLIAMSVCFRVLCKRIGCDLNSATVIALCHPPDELSPVAVGCIQLGGQSVGGSGSGGVGW